MKKEVIIINSSKCNISEFKKVDKGIILQSIEGIDVSGYTAKRVMETILICVVASIFLIMGIVMKDIWFTLFPLFFIILAILTSGLTNILRLKSGNYDMVMGYATNKIVKEHWTEDSNGHKRKGYDYFIEFENTKIAVNETEFSVVNVGQLYIMLVVKNHIIGFMDTIGLPGCDEYLNEVKRGNAVEDVIIRKLNHIDNLEKLEKIDKKEVNTKEVEKELIRGYRKIVIISILSGVGSIALAILLHTIGLVILPFVVGYLSIAINFFAIVLAFVSIMRIGNVKQGNYKLACGVMKSFNKIVEEDGKKVVAGNAYKAIVINNDNKEFEIRFSSNRKKAEKIELGEKYIFVYLNGDLNAGTYFKYEEKFGERID